MYTLQQLYGRIIWNIRDPRSGSTWFLYNLTAKLIRVSYFFDILNPDLFSTKDVYTLPDSIEKKNAINNFFRNRKQDDRDAYKILNTHEYSALESMGNYKDPIIFRNARKNKTEQFASLVIANYTQTYNVHSKDRRSNLPKEISVTVPEGEIVCFIDRVKEAERLWQTYATQYENETVYYEDLQKGWESNIVPVKMLMEGDEDTFNKSNLKPSFHIRGIPGNPPMPLKLPYNYQQIITNYDKIDMVLKNEFGDY